MAPRKRLVIADRTNFLQISQNEGESVVDFLSRLNDASTYCQWDDLKNGKPSEELIKLRFIAGLKAASLKVKILEKLQLNANLDVNGIVDFCQMEEQMSNFVDPKDSATSSKNDVLHVKNSKVCGRCGTGHPPKQCPAFGKECKKCNKQGHFAKMCKSGKMYQRKSNKNINIKRREQLQTHSVDTFTILNDSEGIMKEFVVNGHVLSFQVDTGAGVSILSESQWKKIGSPEMKTTNMRPTNYDGSRIATCGEIELNVENPEDKHNSKVTFVVVKVNKDYGLIGRNVINTDKTYIEMNAVENELLPTIKGFTARLALSDTSKPLKFFKARPVPLHCKSAIEAELSKLEKQGIITPIQFADHASPVVWVKKPDGGFRMCVDFKATLNSNILSDAYPLPTIEEIFGKIGKATKFAKLDLKSAYWQIELDEESKNLSVINTTKGLFTVNRLQMGMKNASAIFQRCIEHIIKGLTGVIAYQDDVLVVAESSTQLHKRLGQLKKRLTEYNVTVNEKKCIEESDSLTFLGFVFSNAGIKPDPSLLRKISEMPVPRNARELASFLGLVNYYGRFIKNFAALCAPLYSLKKSNELDFSWSEQCQTSFQALKEALLAEPVLSPFSLQKTVCVNRRCIRSSNRGGALTRRAPGHICITKTFGCRNTL